MNTMLASFSFIIVLASATVANAETADIRRGRTIYKNHCASCHDNSQHMLNDIGPPLFGVVGRRAGSVEGYNYSQALRLANQRGEKWTGKQLDRFLTSPEITHPGTGMPMHFDKAADRRGIIAYLRTLQTRR